MISGSFKAIVVGGGPVGLTAATALDKAGIDFVLLERRPNVVIDAGSNLVLSPIGIRALDQLGLHDRIEAVTSDLAIMDRLDHAGNNIGDMRIFLHMKSNLGVAPKPISRHDLTKVLYDGLRPEAQAKIHGNKNVSTINCTSDGVLVTCTDGTSYSGSIVIGADGAHSKVRGIMRSLALDAGATNVNAEKPFMTTYRCLWVRFPRMNGLEDGTCCETHGEGAATQLFAGTDSAVTGVYERLDAPTYERQRYTVDDEKALIERWGHLPLTSGGSVKLRDAYAGKIESGLVSLEEGLVDHWSWAGRVVLVGDAAHKFTPSTGAGCNNGIIDIAALMNELQQVIQQAGAQSENVNAVPSTQQLESVFTAYQTARYDMVKAAGDGSSQATASATWQTGVHKFLDRRVMSIHLVQRLLMKLAAQEMTKTPSFKFSHLEQSSSSPMIKV